MDSDKRFKLAYTHEDPARVPSTYSASRKQVYLGVGYGEHKKLPDVYFSSLYHYQNLEGNSPENTSANRPAPRQGIPSLFR